MNYIIQIKSFYDWIELNPLNTSEIALWYALMSINNKTAWSDKFTVPTSVLCRRSGMKDISKSSNFFKARNALAQAGLITWESRKGNQAAEYSITKLYSNSSTHSVGNSVDSSVDNSVGNSVDSSVALNKHKHKQKKTSSRQRKNHVYDEANDYMKLAQYLFKQMQVNDSKAKAPNFQSWADEMRKLVELDKRDKHEVSMVIKWCQHDSFWSTVILSAKKFRAKFGELLLKMNAEKGKSNPPEPPVSKKPVYSDGEQRSIDIMQAFSTHDHDAQQATQSLQAKYPDITLEAVERQVYPERFRKEDVF